MVAVALVLGPHGIAGEVRVSPLTDDPGRLARLGACRVRLPDGSARTMRVAGGRPGPRGTMLLRLDGVRDRDRAESLRGAVLEIPVGDVPPLPEGYFYWFELVGMDVVTEEGEALGSVGGIARGRAQDLLEVQRPGRAGPLLIPAVRAFVVTVDRNRKRLVVRLPPGLVE